MRLQEHRHWCVQDKPPNSKTDGEDHFQTKVRALDIEDNQICPLAAENDFN